MGTVLSENACVNYAVGLSLSFLDQLTSLRYIDLESYIINYNYNISDQISKKNVEEALFWLEKRKFIEITDGGLVNLIRNTEESEKPTVKECSCKKKETPVKRDEKTAMQIEAQRMIGYLQCLVDNPDAETNYCDLQIMKAEQLIALLSEMSGAL